EEPRNTPSPTPIRSPRIHSTLISSDTELGIDGQYRYLFEHLKTAFMPRRRFVDLTKHLQEIMQESLPSMVESQVKEVTNTAVLVYVAERLILERKKDAN
ncbi:hypothetical protein Tco_0302149, partial [Tanacetum coccineum]